MKQVLVALALLALAASAAATHTCGCGQQQPPQYPYPYPSPVQGPSCVGSPIILSQCSEFLRNQCSSMATPYYAPQYCQVLRQQCCQQLRQVEPLHRYQAIYGVVLQSIMQQQPGQVAVVMASQVAQQLLAMCGLHQPGTCVGPYCSAAGDFPY
ncbi:hypothetical protein BS78_02G192100 [Paspalum vaginatum]|nr:hypothetical protein BS78_02G192100 [Paspalum vaginatum]